MKNLFTGEFVAKIFLELDDEQKAAFLLELGCNSSRATSFTENVRLFDYIDSDAIEVVQTLAKNIEERLVFRQEKHAKELQIREKRLTFGGVHEPVYKRIKKT